MRLVFLCYNHRSYERIHGIFSRHSLVVCLQKQSKTDGTVSSRQKTTSRSIPDFCREKTSAPYVMFSFLNSLPFLSAEIEGRHYGGGVLELVPSEIEKLLIPLRSTTESEFVTLDNMIRNNASLDDIVNFTDPIILNKGLGLTQSEVCVIRKAHRRLLKRRLR